MKYIWWKIVDPTHQHLGSSPRIFCLCITSSSLSQRTATTPGIIPVPCYCIEWSLFWHTHTSCNPTLWLGSCYWLLPWSYTPLYWFWALFVSLGWYLFPRRSCTSAQGNPLSYSVSCWIDLLVWNLHSHICDPWVHHIFLQTWVDISRPVGCLCVYTISPSGRLVVTSCYPSRLIIRFSIHVFITILCWYKFVSTKFVIYTTMAQRSLDL